MDPKPIYMKMDSNPSYRQIRNKNLRRAEMVMSLIDKAIEAGLPQRTYDVFISVAEKFITGAEAEGLDVSNQKRRLDTYKNLDLSGPSN